MKFAAVRFLVPLVPLVAAWVGTLASNSLAGEAIDFSRDVRPILSQNCFKCHGVDDKGRKGKLRLDDRAAAIKAASSGEMAIVPGKSGESELIKRINSKDEDEAMPPPGAKNRLTDVQKETLKKWIDQGAEYKPHWAFVAPRQSLPPEVTRKDWGHNPIDQFVLARLEKEGLQPSREADRYTLARRVYLDLIGLPPTPEEADAFVNDISADAYEKLVDRLLASPQYGERWARRWLDLARYADTNGYEKDRPRSIWPYRDWVIQALNADMPFDQFTIEQLAGDMLPNATLQQKIATGFHRNTMRNEEGGIDPLEFRYYSVVDRVATTGTAWLGLTVGCAQCHTHKYDPIRHTEYYQFMAFFNNADEPELDLPSDETVLKRKDVEAKIAKLTAELPNKWPVPTTADWVVANSANTKASTATEATLTAATDQTWQASGPVPLTDRYTFVIETDQEAVDRVRVEVRSDGKSGPGRTSHGNFVLTELKVSASTKEKPKEQKSIKLVRAEADFSQHNFDVADAIDGKPATGWGIAPETKKNHTATFYFEKPVSLGKGSHWTLELEQSYGTLHTLGKVRVSLGGPVKASNANVDERRRELVAKKFDAWQHAESPKAVAWTSLRPAELKSNAPTLTLLPDNSILASGDITKSDTFDLTFKTDLQGITAVRVEALPHDSLPKNGPGMVYYEGPMGDFCLSEISLWADNVAGKFANTAHDFAAGNFESAKAIDGNPQTGWMINGQQGKAHYAVFALDHATGDAKELKLKMLFERHFAPALGHFRISVTTDPRAATPVAVPPAVEAALSTPQNARTTGQTQTLLAHFLQIAPELSEARKEIDKLFRSMPEPPTSLVMTERPAGHARVTQLHNRGEFTDAREEVHPGVPAFLPPLADGATGDRLTFARWLVSRENPLTARVTVNRQWAALFGRGIVRTTEDFGFQGDQPTHPELLDWLAVEFMNQGWSMKKLHRLLVTSSTYRQSSSVSPELIARDPQNLLLARGPRFRVEAEVVRDAALRSSGLLSGKMFGPSVFPPQPASVTTEGAYGKLDWKTSTGEDRYRRSLYTFSKRTAPFAMYNTFDAPTGEACVARREMSNTPLQALTVLNDTVFLEAARSLGQSAATTTGDDALKAGLLFRKILSRPPANEELKMLTAFVASQRDHFTDHKPDAAKFADTKSDNAIEHAAWTAVARAIMNLDEALTKN